MLDSTTPALAPPPVINSFARVDFDGPDAFFTADLTAPLEFTIALFDDALLVRLVASVAAQQVAAVDSLRRLQNRNGQITDMSD